MPPLTPPLLSPQDALLSLGAVIEVTSLRDTLRHALVTLLPTVVRGGAGGHGARSGPLGVWGGAGGTLWGGFSAG